MAVPTVHFVMTGGTIDSYYDGAKDMVVPYKKSIIPKFIKGLNLHIKTDFTEVCMKDSRDMVLADLEGVKKTIEDSKHTKFIITHGTYCIPNTAEYLKDHLKAEDKTIVFTGSIVPPDVYMGSDALFNIGFATAEVLRLRPGIYLCMNGKVIELHLYNHLFEKQE